MVVSPPQVNPYEARLALALEDFDYFLGYVVIQEPPTAENPSGGSAIPFARWPHLIEIAGKLLTERLYVVPKARQVGLSWLLASYALWVAMSRSGAVVFLFSKGEDEAKVFLGKVSSIYWALPAWLQTGVKSETVTEMIFRNGSKIHAFPSTKDAGRSETASLVIQDEADYHPWIDANYAAVKPTTDAGGQLVIVSTVNKRNMASLFKGIVRDSMRGTNGYSLTFVGYDVRPGRDGDWYERTRATVPATEGMSPELYMEQEYPRTLEEALQPARSLAFFNVDAVAALLRDCREPMDMRQSGTVKIWGRPVVARKYVGFGDVAWGQTGAYSCFVLAEWSTGVQVAEIHGRLEHDHYAQLIHDLVKEYNNAYFGIEANGEGDSERSGLNVINKLIALGLGNRMYHHGEKWDEVPNHRGWMTNGTTRPVMLGGLEEAVRFQGVRPLCRDALQEMTTFVLLENGKLGPLPGAYADHVMAWAGLSAEPFRNKASFGASGRPQTRVLP